MSGRRGPEECRTGAQLIPRRRGRGPVRRRARPPSVAESRPPRRRDGGTSALHPSSRAIPSRCWPRSANAASATAPSGARLVCKLVAMAGEAGWVEDAGEDPDPCPGSPALMIEEEWAKVMRRSRIDGALGQNLRTALQGNRPTAPPSRKRAWPSSVMRPGRVPGESVGARRRGRQPCAARVLEGRPPRPPDRALHDVGADRILRQARRPVNEAHRRRARTGRSKRHALSTAPEERRGAHDLRDRGRRARPVAHRTAALQARWTDASPGEDRSRRSRREGREPVE